MRIAILLGLLVTLIASSDALRCWTCENQGSLQACITAGVLSQCQANENACETHVRRDGNRYNYFKTCKQALACVNNEIQNPREAATPSQCNVQGTSSVCRCCCYRDGCGRFTDNCTEIETTPTPPPPLTCAQPIFPIDNGELACGSSLPNGRYALQHRCNVECNEGFSVTEVGNAFTVCTEVSANGRREASWQPVPSSCTSDPRFFCLLPPLWENGTVDCNGPVPSGGFPIGHQCTYACTNEGDTLVGNDVTICTRFEGSNARFTPGPPCCEPRCEPNRPADILFVLDHSTSILRRRWPILTGFARDVMRRFQSNAQIHFGVEVYGAGVLLSKNIRFAPNSASLQARVAAITYNPPTYGTQTTRALNYARETAFTSAFGDRPGVPNYVIFITDGVSSDDTPRGSLEDAAAQLHQVTNGVYAIGVAVPARFAAQSRRELGAIASDPRFISRVDDFARIFELLEQVTTIVCERQCAEPRR